MAFSPGSLNQTSRFGAFLDPVADKLMVAAALVLIVQADPRVWLAITAAIIIIGREIAVSGLREFMAEIGQRSTGQGGHDRQGQDHGHRWWRHACSCSYRGARRRLSDLRYRLCLADSTRRVLTLWSMFVYLRAAWPIMKPGPQDA